MKFVGHRGASAVKPESTMSAFMRAVALGLSFECDLQVIRTGEVVVLHDSTLERTAAEYNPATAGGLDEQEYRALVTMPAANLTLHMMHLGNNLLHAKMPTESHLPGGTEDTAHGATLLSAYTGRETTGKSHQDNLHLCLALQFEQILSSPPILTGDLFREPRCASRGAPPVPQPSPQRRRQGLQLFREPLQVLVKGLEQRKSMGPAQAVCNKTFLQLLETLAGKGHAASTLKGPPAQRKSRS